MARPLLCYFTDITRETEEAEVCAALTRTGRAGMGKTHQVRKKRGKQPTRCTSVALVAFCLGQSSSLSEQRGYVTKCGIVSCTGGKKQHDCDDDAESPRQ